MLLCCLGQVPITLTALEGTDWRFACSTACLACCCCSCWARARALTMDMCSCTEAAGGVFCMVVFIVRVGVAAAENDHGQQQEREPGTCQGAPYSHFWLQHSTRKDENHDSESTDIEKSLLREPWQLEYWDLRLNSSPLCPRCRRLPYTGRPR